MPAVRRVSIDVGHPAHVHFFRNLCEILKREGCEVTIFARGREHTISLLNAFKMEYVSIGSAASSVVGKAWRGMQFVFRMRQAIGGRIPDIFLSTGSPYSGVVSRITNRRHMATLDTEGAVLTILLLARVSDSILTFSGVEAPVKGPFVRIDSYKELAYLHPRYFVPDAAVIRELGLKEGEYSVFRIARYEAVHDRHHKGLAADLEMLRRFIRQAEKHGRVVLTTEAPLGDEFKKYQIPIPEHEIHHLLAYASLYVGEGATMASEAAVLGVPFIFLSPSHRGYLDDLERTYGMGYTVKEKEDALRKMPEIFENHQRSDWAANRRRMLSEKIDITKYFHDHLGEWAGWEEPTQASL